MFILKCRKEIDWEGGWVFGCFGSNELSEYMYVHMYVFWSIEIMLILTTKG